MFNTTFAFASFTGMSMWSASSAFGVLVVLTPPNASPSMTRRQVTKEGMNTLLNIKYLSSVVFRPQSTMKDRIALTYGPHDAQQRITRRTVFWLPNGGK